MDERLLPFFKYYRITPFVGNTSCGRGNNFSFLIYLELSCDQLIKDNIILWMGAF